jgi:hypothetical protein
MDIGQVGGYGKEEHSGKLPLSLFSGYSGV